jgi:hypothetical protein
MADSNPGPDVAETTVALDDLRVDPAHTSDDGGEPAPVWGESQYLRELIERGKAGQDPTPTDRALLVGAVNRQVRQSGLYREVARLILGPRDRTAPRELTLIVLLFPGEGRDNTGIKDLNDKVLGYALGNEFIRRRQKEIETIFPPATSLTAPPAPGFTTVGQDYKTASIVAFGKTPRDFATELVRLDAALRQHLLELLAIAEKSTTDRKRLEAIRKLRTTLQRDRRYRFDFLFGVSTLGAGPNAVGTLLRLLTETLKGAGMARFAAKTTRLGTKTGRQLGADRGLEAVPKGHDARGRVYEVVAFLRVLRAARDIKELVSGGVTGDQLDLQNIFVDQVWTVAFLLRKRLFWANPDVVRDVRKKALKPPKFLRQGVKFAFKEQQEVLELWLVTVNMLDLIKDFLTDEVTTRLEPLLGEALIMLEHLADAAHRIDWDRLEHLLTRDVQRTPDPLPVLGTTSEYQFYGPASDHPDRIFFSMDIRDLGVEVIATYEIVAKVIDDGQLGEQELLRQTLLASDATVLRRRVTYTSVVAVFGKYHRLLSQQPGLHAHATKAFGGPLEAAPLPAFELSVHVMLGGDEVFVAVHPYFSAVEHLIIADLALSTYRPGEPLNMRTGLVYSSAKRATGTGQRRENQIAHDQAMKLAADAPGLVKPLERAHRRIERLIEKLEARDSKAVKGQFYRRSLDGLGLLRLYARGRRGFARPLSDDLFARVRRLLREENVAAALDTGLFELVDFRGARVDVKQLTARVAELEAKVVQEVGLDNRHDDGPPVRMFPPLPGWLKGLLNDWADGKGLFAPTAPAAPSAPPPPPRVTAAFHPIKAVGSGPGR